MTWFRTAGSARRVLSQPNVHRAVTSRECYGRLTFADRYVLRPLPRSALGRRQPARRHGETAASARRSRARVVLRLPRRVWESALRGALRVRQQHRQAPQAPHVVRPGCEEGKLTAGPAHTPGEGRRLLLFAILAGLHTTGFEEVPGSCQAPPESPHHGPGASPGVLDRPFRVAMVSVMRVVSLAISWMRIASVVGTNVAPRHAGRHNEEPLRNDDLLSPWESGAPRAGTPATAAHGGSAGVVSPAGRPASRARRPCRRQTRPRETLASGSAGPEPKKAGLLTPSLRP